MKIRLQLPFNYGKEDYDYLLKSHKVKHLRRHTEDRIKVGDGIKSSTGVIARVVDRFANYENLTIDITIANNNMTMSDMYEHFGYKGITT